jgi:UDP-N-acetyl-D-mannosaminuronate dehydrogenase
MKGVKQCVIGKGEIGKGIAEVLKCPAFDKEGPDGTYDVIHICYPYSVDFEANTRAYAKGTDLVIVHSTVPVGTCDKHGWVHSPVRGRHPHLAESIRQFVKFFGGERSIEASDLFPCESVCTPEARNTEAMKLWDTTIYGVNIILEKEIHAYCKEQDLDFNIVYTLANETYNEGYEKLNEPQFKKYILSHQDGEIGGHCVNPNVKLLNNELINTLWTMKK